MTGAEAGFLLLCSPLGDPDRKILTPAQLRTLGRLTRDLNRTEPDRDLTVEDLLSLGYGEPMARRIWGLLQEGERLEYYIQQGKSYGCVVLTQVSAHFPKALFDKLGLEGPGSIWCKGDGSALHGKMLSLVGSRELLEDNRQFAREVGRQAAIQGYTLVSGNARGADQAAQAAALEAGGKVIAVVADGLLDKPLQENLLYISEEGFDLPFSPQRALSRNRIIHALPEKTFVAQCGYQEGGTWSGTVKNLRFHWSPVYCYGDGSPAQRLLGDMGAEEVTLQQLADLEGLPGPDMGFIEYL